MHISGIFRAWNERWNFKACQYVDILGCWSDLPALFSPFYLTTWMLYFESPTAAHTLHKFARVLALPFGSEDYTKCTQRGNMNSHLIYTTLNFHDSKNPVRNFFINPPCPNQLRLPNLRKGKTESEMPWWNSSSQVSLNNYITVGWAHYSYWLYSMKTKINFCVSCSQSPNTSDVTISVTSRVEAKMTEIQRLSLWEKLTPELPSLNSPEWQPDATRHQQNWLMQTTAEPNKNVKE